MILEDHLHIRTFFRKDRGIRKACSIQLPDPRSLTPDTNILKHIKMSLLTDIKWKRKQQNKKEPIKRNVFNQISHIVSKYRLDKKFLKALDGVEDYLSNGFHKWRHFFEEFLYAIDPEFNRI